MEKSFAPFIHIDNVLISFLREYFKFHPKYPWSEKEEDSKIRIDEAYSDSEEERGSSAEIIIRRGNFDSTAITMGGNAPERGKKLIDWSQERQKLYNAGALYQVIVTTKFPRETLDIAEEIQSTLLMYTEQIADAFAVKISEHISSNTDQLLATGKTKEFSTVMMSVAASYQYKIGARVLPRYEKLKGIDLLGQVDKTVKKETKLKFETLQFNKKINEDNDT